MDLLFTQFTATQLTDDDLILQIIQKYGNGTKEVKT